MKTYTLAPQAIQPIKWRTLIAAVLALILAAELIYVGILMAFSVDFTLPWVPAAAFAIALVIVTAAALSARRQVSVLKSIKVTISNHKITREQLRFDPVEIERDEVKDIVATGLGLAIMTADKTRNLLIPYHLVDEHGNPADAEIRQNLEAWTPIRAQIQRPKR